MKKMLKIMKRMMMNHNGLIVFVYSCMYVCLVMVFFCIDYELSIEMCYFVKLLRPVRTQRSTNHLLW